MNAGSPSKIDEKIELENQMSAVSSSRQGNLDVSELKAHQMPSDALDDGGWALPRQVTIVDPPDGFSGSGEAATVLSSEGVDAGLLLDAAA